MNEKRRKVSGGYGALLVAVAVGACDAPMPTEVRDAVEEVIVDQGRRGAHVAREGVSLEGWGYLRYEGAPLVYLDGVRIVLERPEDMPEPVRSFLADPIWDPLIERVEVLKRADAAKLYGPVAAGGVIHVFTKDPDAIKEQRDVSTTAPGLREAATDTRVLVSRVARTLEERQTVLKRAAFVASAPIVNIDGVRVDPGGPEMFELLPTDIERMEVIKGRCMAHLFYGEEASGIILILTKGAPDLSTAEALLGEDRGFTKEEGRRMRAVDGCGGL